MKGITLSALVLAASLAWSPIIGATEKGETVFTEDFNDEGWLNAWTIVDVNGGRTWEPLNGMAAYMLDFETGLPGDDWLMSPAFSLDGEKVYDLSVYVGSISMSENIRICVGSAPTPDAMTQVLADYKDMTNAQNGTKTLKIIPSESGTYYLGFYAYSAPEQHRVEIDNVVITDAGSKLAPSPVTGLTVSRGDQGALVATVSFTTPTSAIGGTTLSEISGVEVKRGDQIVHTFTSVASGEELSYTDSSMPGGFNTYTVQAYNTMGASDPVSVTEFIGTDTTHGVSDLLARVEQNGSVTVTWKAPATTVNGGYADFGKLTYKVMRADGAVVSDGSMTQPTFNDPRPILEGQGIVYYTVSAITADGKESEARESNKVSVGSPLSLPYAESFAGGEMAYAWTVDGTVNEMDWEVVPDDEDGEFEGIMTYDNDNGMMMVNSKWGENGSQSRLVSPMIDLSTASNPELKFWFHQARSPWYDPEWDGEINDHLEVQICPKGGEWTTLPNATYYVNERVDTWIECTVSLPANAPGSYANIGLLATSEADDYGYRNMYVDDIRIDESLYAHDLMVDAFTTDHARADVGQKTTLTTTIYNRSNAPADGYQLCLYRDGTLYESIDGPALEGLEKKEIKIEYTPTLTDAETQQIIWEAEIVYDADDNRSNDRSQELSWSVRRPNMDTVEGLEGELQGQGVALKWQSAHSYPAPTPGDRVRFNDDFEAYQPFSIDAIGDYTLWDRDGCPTMASPRIPNYPGKGQEMAYQVFNAVQAGVWCDDNQDLELEPHSGSQYLICPSVDDNLIENDDWIVTPELDGREQTISFWAKGVSFDSEWIDVLYSTTDSHYDSFTSLTENGRVYIQPNWREYTYNVPDGTRYVAIRCIRRTVMLLIDDLSFDIHDGQHAEATLIGYNVYRDGVCVNGSTPIAVPEFFDDTVGSGNHTYRVTALYEQGESALSEPLTIAATVGVDGVLSDTLRVDTATGGLRIECNGEHTVTIVSVDGRTCWRGTVSGTTQVSLPAGIYIVSSSNGAVKAIVRS